ncbi:MAG: hypothetical protein FRX49_04466 [Trebouxia sp. A1-2]|nr:MAG: hypothetical protein FRX49_04466 [Trebouxia sp. A1-2]
MAPLFLTSDTTLGFLHGGHPGSTPPPGMLGHSPKKGWALCLSRAVASAAPSMTSPMRSSTAVAPSRRHTGFMIAGAPHLHPLYGCQFAVIPALKQYNPHDKCKADPSVDKNTSLREANRPAGDEDLAVA